MTATEYGSDVNMEELRSQLTQRLASLPLVGAGSLLLWLSFRHQSLSLTALGLALGLVGVVAGLGWSVQGLVGAHPVLARHLLAWSLTLGLLAAMWLSPHPWLPFVGLMLLFINAMLISGGEFATAGVVAALTMWLVLSGTRAYPLLALLITLAAGTVSAWQIKRTLYTALEWAWNMQQRSDHLLELARDRQGQLSNALKSVDIANATLRRTHRELIVARKQAEEARLMKEQFAANVSHELRTPLNLILGFSEVMCLSSEVYGDMDWPPALRQDIFQIYTSSRHLLDMIDDVLDLSRFELVGFTLKKELTPLESLLRGAIEIVENLFRDRPIHLEVEIAHNLPALEVDRTRIRQVLLNLLNNAARFTEQGTVRVEAKRADGEVMISVSDTGPGIPADELPHLFEEFYQVDRSLHRKHGGAGLGLAISKHFVEAHDGCIWVASPSAVRQGAEHTSLTTGKGGPGSTFTFTLPIPGAHTPYSRLQAGRPLEPPEAEGRPSILVLDPDPAVATLISRHIEGYDVVHVDDVGRLAEQVNLHHPQAVVHNVPPKEEGEHREILSAPVPVIECSLPCQAWLADDLAVTACLSKPITTARLLQETRRLGSIRDVLVVDDDRGFCRLVERMLMTGGDTYHVRKAYDGEAGLQALRTERPDLVLLDLIMPGVDGFQVLDHMRREPALTDVPIVLLTANLAEDALVYHKSQVVIRRSDGLGSAEVLRCLQAIVSVLRPHYDERSFESTPHPIGAERPEPQPA